ncbi:hypothetical protein TSAR_004822 [Trichomalopsis sarcophagae]|uniref:SET domain-containing protein n=1 Tax=Trichomalopsis sarcophagae TaxID=543379 RepID=A0A232FDT1_9HYME|nr:hypothetical protein TSAR_004822 [Trichomalopsis sarcophagae]
MDNERQAIIRGLAEPKVEMILKAWFKRPMKSTDASIKAREDGNRLFIAKGHNSEMHENIWKFYSESIANAPSASNELALAYGNRSALLLHLQKFQESIQDIDRALAITTSSNLKEKLLKRKATCVTALAEDETAEDIGNKTKVLSLNKEELIKNVSNIIPNNDFNFSGKIEEDKAKIQEILATKKAADPYDSVSIQHNEKFGRHLIANRYIKPGEIIMVIKPYIKCLNLKNMHAFCGHCLKTSWATIPCDYCNWCMFCSEDCKQEAWQQYHDIECPVIPYIMFDQLGDYWKQLALRSTVMAIREAGGIQNLKEELDLVDNCNSKLHKGFLNGKFYNDRFQSIYSLSDHTSENALKVHIDHALLSLIVLTKSTTLFGKNMKFMKSKDLLSNEDVIFIGSLLLKFLKISDINTHSVMEGSSLCRFSKNLNHCLEDRCCARGACIAPIPSMLNHSCDPNIRKCFTEDMHLIIYALQPIKKNTQLFDSYLGCYFQTPMSQRQLAMKEFNFTCNCTPCRKKWPAILIDKTKTIVKKENEDFEQKLFDKLRPLFQSTENLDAHYCLSTLDYLSGNIEKATSNLIPPSYVTALLISTLWTQVCCTDIVFVVFYLSNKMYHSEKVHVLCLLQLVYILGYE